MTTTTTQHLDNFIKADTQGRGSAHSASSFRGAGRNRSLNGSGGLTQKPSATNKIEEATTMTVFTISLMDIRDEGLSFHNERIEDIAEYGEYEHNMTPITVIAHNDGETESYTLVTGGHRANSACYQEYDSIDALVIPDTAVNHEKWPLDYLWTMNEEDEIINALGAENFN